MKSVRYRGEPVYQPDFAVATRKETVRRDELVGASPGAWRWLGYTVVRDGMMTRLPAETFGPLPPLPGATDIYAGTPSGVPTWSSATRGHQTLPANKLRYRAGRRARHGCYRVTTRHSCAPQHQTKDVVAGRATSPRWRAHANAVGDVSPLRQ
jgi:hypothetical protein